MADTKPGTGLAERVKTGVVEKIQVVEALTAGIIRDPIELAENMRQLQEVAHIITPAASVAVLPPHIFIQRIPVVIDTKFDAKTGRGTDVYFQSSIHKSIKRSDDYWEPQEVSLNANAIKRIIGSAGIDITASERVDDGSKPNYVQWTTRGRVREFDGSWRELLPGDVEIDLRDGSDHIGKWNAEDWPEAVRDAEERKAEAKKKGQDHWKIKPEIGGFSLDRVMQQRKSLIPVAQTKSANRLGRNLGLKQIYSLEELKKPFVIFRASFMHDTSNPRIAEMLSLHELGALNLMFQPATGALPPAVTTSQAPQLPATPEEATEVDDIPEETAEKPVDTFTVSKLSLLGDYYYAETAEGRTFVTDDKGTARSLNEARKAGTKMLIDGELVQINDKPFLKVVDCKPYKPSLPRVEDL